ncbi:MAG: hypothetical protein QOJ88_498 [Pyrinomonadaceae bacterium]|nr:hypothetical protein [Pyrinomonadaceae bacterium]
MRQRLGIILTIVAAVGILIAVNSAAYVGEERKQDSEFDADRSTYNAGATGTRALYDFLRESGYPVLRWREAPARLLGTDGPRVKTFVIVGRPLVAINEEEARSLLRWVQQGGRLVIVDRRPEDYLLPPSGLWRVVTELITFPGAGVDPAHPEQMTEGVKPINPALPTLFTRDVDSVMPSKFLSAIKLFTESEETSKQNADNSNRRGFVTTEKDYGPPPPPDAPAKPAPGVVSVNSPATATLAHAPAPVVHLIAGSSPLLIDYPHGNGQIVLLSDPFMVANGGIGLRDNLQLAINLLTTDGGRIAFDEFHQGHGATHNPWVNYFAGTPVLALCAQLALLILLLLWTRGRRFARPLPLPQVDRRSNLEFVASMAELQQRARAYDLAIENIYSRLRRVLARFAGVDYNSSRKLIAEGIALRAPVSATDVERLMRQSEDAINGEPFTERQSLLLVRSLRELESTLGLRLRSREVKQSLHKS